MDANKKAGILQGVCVCAHVFARTYVRMCGCMCVCACRIQELDESAQEKRFGLKTGITAAREPGVMLRR